MAEILVLSSRPVKFEIIKPEKVVVDGKDKEKTTKYKPMGLRLTRLKAKAKKMLSK